MSKWLATGHGSQNFEESVSLSVTPQTRVLEIVDETAMMDLGARLYQLAEAGDVITLRGDLGAGKTVLARGFIRKACVREGEALVDFDVPSPTFTLVQTYDASGKAGAGVSIWHFDLYRLEASGDIWELGFEEALDDGISLIEWPERAASLLPDERLDLVLETRTGSDIRDVTLKPGPSWDERIEDVWTG